MPPDGSRGHAFLQHWLSNVTLPLPSSRRNRHASNQDLVFLGIAGRSAIDDNLVPDFECEFAHAAFSQLSYATPFTAPPRRLAVLIGNFKADEGMGIAKVELHDLSFDRHNLILDIRARKRVMAICGDAGHERRDNHQGN